MTATPAKGDRPRLVPATIGVLVVAGLAGRFGPRPTMLVLGPVAAVFLLFLARRAGLTPAELGLCRRALLRGAVFAAVSVVLVAVVYAVAVAVPAARSAFLDERYRVNVPTAMLSAFVVIPFGTILFEEVAFRGVLWGQLHRDRGPMLATVVSSALFGLWHVGPSVRLNQVNPAVAAVVGPGLSGRVLAVAGAVMFTALAGVLLCELRRRSGSLLAPAGMHWAVNGLGVLVTAAVTR